MPTIKFHLGMSRGAAAGHPAAAGRRLSGLLLLLLLLLLALLLAAAAAGVSTVIAVRAGIPRGVPAWNASLVVGCGLCY